MAGLLATNFAASSGVCGRFFSGSLWSLSCQSFLEAFVTIWSLWDPPAAFSGTDGLSDQVGISVGHSLKVRKNTGDSAGFLLFHTARSRPSLYEC